MIRILIADDHQVVREALRSLLEGEGGFQVVGDTGDGLEAVRLVEKLEPHVLLMDLAMPGLGGLEVTREVTKRFPRTAVVVLSMHSSEAYVTRALQNGASAYVTKESGGNDLLHAIREAAEGRHYLSPPLSQRAVDTYFDRARTAPLEDYDRLTTREREVLHLVAEGHSSAEIAQRLYISPRTVEGHRSSLMRKLGLHSQFDLATFALEKGLVSKR